MKKLAVFGSLCMDVYTEGGKQTAFCGGGPLNMAVQAARCGIETFCIGAVGTDAYGSRMRRVMRQNGVDDRFVVHMEGKTAVSEVYLHGEERILGEYDPGVLTQFHLSEEDMRRIAAADLCVTDLWGMQEDALAKLKEYGARIVFDAADRPGDPVSQKAMRSADLFFFSDDREEADVIEEMRRIRAEGVLLAAAMRGTRGSLVMDENGIHRCGIVPNARVIDTLGAGDSYIGGFLAAYLKDEPIEACMKNGASCASSVLGFHGAFAQEV